MGAVELEQPTVKPSAEQLSRLSLELELELVVALVLVPVDDHAPATASRTAPGPPEDAHLSVDLV